MLKTRIIPCLDVKDGRVVKGINFLDLVDAGDPVKQASYYSQNGADEICFLDISASLENRNTMINIVKKTAEEVFIPLTVGGGISSIQNIRSLLKAGADKVSINSAAIENQKIVQESSDHFGSQCIVVAVDVKKIENDWIVFSHGGTINTNINALKWLEKIQKLGAGEILLTSMDKDGTKSGFDIELLKVATGILQIPVIASGGVGTKEHFFEGVFEGGASALLAASVFHFNEFSIKEVKKFNSWIRRERDLKFTYAGLRQVVDKYLVQDRSSGDLYETPQDMYMMIAATLFADYPEKTRLSYVKKYYDAISLHKINIPTPVMSGVRTPIRQFASCVLVDIDDTLPSIFSGDMAIGLYVARRAGIGINAGRIRGINSKIRGGEVQHTGVIPFLKKFESTVRCCTQNGVRGGNATVHFPIWHNEIEDILVLKNNKGTEDNRVRKMDYSIQISKLFYELFSS